MAMATHHRRPAAKRAPYEGTCQEGCGQKVLVLLNNRTNRWAAVDYWPEPGGNIEVSLSARSYRVIPPADRDAADATTANPDAHPNLYVMHIVNCPKAARRRAAKAEQGILPLGAEATATVRRHGRPRCSECEEKLTIDELAAGLLVCRNCTPAKETP